MKNRLAMFVLGALGASSLQPAVAQTWQWPLTVAKPGGASVHTRSSIVLTSGNVSTLYSVRLNGKDATISACHVALHDIADVTTVTRAGRAFVIIKVKPARTVACDAGAQSLAIAPTADANGAQTAVTAIRNACCGSSVAVAAAAPSPSAIPTATATPTSSPSPRSTARVASTADWVETSGLFAFVRVRNRAVTPAAILGGNVQNCKNIDAGCGPIAQRTIAAGATSTIATVLMRAEGDAPRFTYRYDVQAGAQRTTIGGWTNKSSVAAVPMTATEVRSAEAVAIASVRSASSPAPAIDRTATPLPNADARLTHRGSSRLAIGHKGTAMLRVQIAADGSPQNAEIVRISDRQLAAAAIETAVSSTYAPAIHDGRAIASTYIATFQFDGDDPALATVPAWKRDPSPGPTPSDSR